MALPVCKPPLTRFQDYFSLLPMTDAELIDKLIVKAGGLKALVEEMGVTRQAVWNWKTTGPLTPFARLKILACAKRNKIAVPADFLERT